MKKLLLLLAFPLLLLSLPSCKKEKTDPADGWQEASLIGQDFRLCACCGGWFIDLGQDTVRTFTLPEDFKIESQPDLPIKVLLKYQTYTGPCEDFAPLIVVDKIVKQ